MKSLLKKSLIALVLLTAFMQAARAQFFTDVKVIANKNLNEVNSLRTQYQNLGWKVIEKDLNEGAGGAYIYMLYKTGGTTDAITGFYLRVSEKNDSPESLNFNGRRYYRASYDGSSGFKNAKGDLNNEAGGKFIHLYYTKDAITPGQFVYRVYFNDKQDSVVGENGGSYACDINKGARGSYIYMHVLESDHGRDSVPYIERYWDSSAAAVRETAKSCDDYNWLEGSENATTLASGWYVVDHDAKYKETLNVMGNVRIILCDGATLNAQQGIYIQFGQTLTVYGQSGDSGKLYAHPDNNIAGIGGVENKVAGHFIMHGGEIDAQGGSNNYAGIGGGDHDSGIQEVTIYGGKVSAVGRNSAAGIGKGQQNKFHETVTIYGGTVYAQGGYTSNNTSDHAGAGIGGGEDCGNGNIIIYGGDVTAIGTEHAAGIGGGEQGAIANPIRIHGGTVRASTNKTGGAGIGSGERGKYGIIEITGGEVYAEGACGAAGIGGGWGSEGAEITITGGNVYAKGGGVQSRYSEGTGIGGYDSAITILDGFVTAVAGGDDNQAFRLQGSGELVIGDDMCVRAGSSAGNATMRASDKRVSAAKSSVYATVEPCRHVEYNEDGSCRYCLVGKQGLIFPETEDNADLIHHNHMRVSDVTLGGRTLYKDGSWNTLCLPFSLITLKGTPLEGATLRMFTGAVVKDGVVTLTFGRPVTSVQAGMPYIVKWDSGEDITDPVFNKVLVENTVITIFYSGVTFFGTYGPENLTADNGTKVYIGTGNKLYIATDKDLKVNAFHGFFLLDKSITTKALRGVEMRCAEPVAE